SQVLFEMTDRGITPLPKSSIDPGRRTDPGDMLPDEILRMHLYDHHLFIVAAVVYTDEATGRDGLCMAPEEIVRQLLNTRGFETPDAAPLRVHPTQHVRDRHVLACTIHG